MFITPYCTELMKYQLVQVIAAKYYSTKMKKKCCVMKQNGRWTVVTFTM